MYTKQQVQELIKNALTIGYRMGHSTASNHNNAFSSNFDKIKRDIFLLDDVKEFEKTGFKLEEEKLEERN